MEKKSGNTELIWLVACLVSVHACMTSMRVSTSLWVLNQGYGEWVMGLLLSCYSFGPLLLALYVGRMVDRYGFHLPVVISVGAGFTSAMLAVLFRYIEVLFVSALLMGVAISIGEIAIQNRAGKLAAQGRDLKSVFGWIALSTAMSNTLSPVLMGFTIDNLGYGQAFMLAGLLPIVAWFGSRRIARVDAPAQSTKGAGGALELLKIKPLRRLLLINFSLAAGWDVHTFAVPVIGHERLYSASTIGMILGACSVGAMAARAMMARFSEGLDEDRALRMVMLVTMTTLVVYPLLPVPWAMMIGSALLGFSIGAVQPLVLSALHKSAPPGMYGQALGLRMVATSGATAGMPMLFGAVAAASAAAMPMWMMAGVVAMVAVVLR